MHCQHVSKKRMSAWFAILALIYVTPYFLCSEIYHGQWQGLPIKLRLFHGNFEVALWFPLLKLEQIATPGEFGGQVRNGASLPPPDPAYRQTE